MNWIMVNSAFKGKRANSVDKIDVTQVHPLNMHQQPADD